ncbi:cell division protein FtsL [Comamonadaceae bacterium PP-2]
MTRVNLLLLLTVVLSALGVVHAQHDSRNVFVALDRATNESRKLEIEFERLQVEKRAQATHLRVEQLAKEKLQMRTPTPAITDYVGVKVPQYVPPEPKPAAAAGRTR